MKKGAKEIKLILAQKMTVWEAGQFDILANNMEYMWKTGDGIKNETILNGDDRIDSLGR